MLIIIDIVLIHTSHLNFKIPHLYYVVWCVCVIVLIFVVDEDLMLIINLKLFKGGACYENSCESIYSIQ